MVAELFLLVRHHKREQEPSNVLCSRRMGSHADDARMSGQRQNGPVPEVLIHRHEDSFLCDRATEDFIVIRRCLPCFAGT